MKMSFKLATCVAGRCGVGLGLLPPSKIQGPTSLAPCGNMLVGVVCTGESVKIKY